MKVNWSIEVGAATLAVIGVAANAQMTFTWEGGDWSDGNNWDLGIVPYETAVVVGNGSVTGFAENTDIVVQKLNFVNGENVTFDDVAAMNLTEIVVGGDTRLVWNSGSIADPVDLTVGSVSSGGHIELNDVTATIATFQVLDDETHKKNTQDIETVYASCIAPKVTVNSSDSYYHKVAHGSGSGMKLDATAEIANFIGPDLTVGYVRYNGYRQSCLQPTEIKGELTIHEDLSGTGPENPLELEVGVSRGVGDAPWCTDANKTSYTIIEGKLTVKGDVKNLGSAYVGFHFQSLGGTESSNNFVKGDAVFEKSIYGAMGSYDAELEVGYGVQGPGLIESKVRIMGSLVNVSSISVGQSNDGQSHINAELRVDGDVIAENDPKYGSVSVGRGSAGSCNATVSIGGKLTIPFLYVGANSDDDQIFLELENGAQIANGTQLDKNAHLKLHLGPVYEFAKLDLYNTPTVELDASDLIGISTVLNENGELTVMKFSNESFGAVRIVESISGTSLVIQINIISSVQTFENDFVLVRVSEDSSGTRTLTAKLLDNSKSAGTSLFRSASLTMIIAIVFKMTFLW